ncbi:MAG: EF-P lysine aminoacylase EpmA [Gammaproteobacteria bacterium]|jgi:lysyl-tRNA synthetase class 2
MTLQRGAPIEVLRRRAELLMQLRSFFAQKGVWEVDTASLSAAASPDPALQSMRLAGPRAAGYLHTSPEYMMKRLIAQGSGDIYQLCRVYRDGELGRWHEPEFMLLEWYRIGYDEHALMDEVAELVTKLLGSGRLRADAQRITYDAALLAATGLASDADTASIRQALISQGIEVPAQTDHDDVLDLAMASVVSRRFPQDALTFVHDYPVSQAALARINPGARPRAARFEVFLGSLELGNGFRELTDAREQRARFETENAARAAKGLTAVALDEGFLAALAAGLPECSGVALGFDRVVAAALGAESLSEVLAFTHFSP